MVAKTSDIALHFKHRICGAANETPAHFIELYSFLS